MIRLITFLVLAAWLTFVSQVAVSSPMERTPAVPEKEYSPTLQLDAKVEANDEGLPRRISGTIQIDEWHPKNSFCFYTPYNDNNYGENRGTGRHLELVNRKFLTVAFRGGGTKITLPEGSALKLKSLSSDVMKLTWAGDSFDAVTIGFESIVPRLPSTNDDSWFYDGFYPVPLVTCPATSDANLFKFYPKMKIRASISSIEGWAYAGINNDKKAGNQIKMKFDGPSISFALARSFKKISFDASGTRVSLYYHNQEFLDLIPTIKNAMLSFTTWLGDFPFPSLSLIESSELQRDTLPGIIAFNRPRQDAFVSLQSEWINWQHWIITSLIARQWFGASVTTSSIDDKWLLSGTVDFLTLVSLKEATLRYNLFNVLDSGSHPLSLDFLQMQNLIAALLHRFAPLSVLTDQTFSSAVSYDAQHPLLFIKHALALRYIHSYIGSENLALIMKHFVSRYSFHSVTPKNFYDFIEEKPSPLSPEQRVRLSSILSKWWTKDGWADYSLENFEKQRLPNGEWIAKTQLIQKGNINVPVDIQVTDVDGRAYTLKARHSKTAAKQLKAEIITKSEPDLVEIDPKRHAFDIDRFNNTNRPAGVNFFPGSANTLKDDAYTVIWLPYAFRRPAEATSIAIQGAVFRYVQGSTFFVAEASPSDKLGGYYLRHNIQTSLKAINTEFIVQQNYENERILEGGFQRAPLFAGNPRISVAIKARQKQILGIRETSHQTFALHLSAVPVTYSLFGFKSSAEIEHAPRGLSSDFSYEKKTLTLNADLKILGYFEGGLRAFGGALYKKGEVPSSVLFKPNSLREAHLRLDVKNLDRVNRIAAVNTDLFFPLALPISSKTMVLSRRIKGQLFHDYGYSPDNEVHYKAAGAGFIMPFGGDFVGSGALAITHLKVLAVLYTAVAGEVSKKPSILFDFSGEL